MLVVFAAWSDQIALYLEGLLGLDADYVVSVLRIVGTFPRSQTLKVHPRTSTKSVTPSWSLSSEVRFVRPAVLPLKSAYRESSPQWFVAVGVNGQESEPLMPSMTSPAPERFA